MDDIRFMSMVYKLLNSLIISLETYQFDDIQPKDLDNWKKEQHTVIRLTTIADKYNHIMTIFGKLFNANGNDTENSSYLDKSL